MVVIDEAAAIPLPYVRALLGPYLVFISSTVNGYEGTGRSLSLKLIKELRDQAVNRDNNSSLGRTFREISLKDPIRYSLGDSVESWLNQLLCMDTHVEPIPSAPKPEMCDLFYLDRDTLFSYHKVSEFFLQRVMSLYVTANYKNSPNDLMLMSDAPAHHLFVLLEPTDENSTRLPHVLCVVQVCLEGEISKDSLMKSLGKGKRPTGDLIPWNISMQFQDEDFPSLSGARIIRIATHPQLYNKGYGTRALELLTAYYEGKISKFGCSDSAAENDDQREDLLPSDENLRTCENIKPRTHLPPLLRKLDERTPERLHYLGTSFGFSPQLFRFWKRNHFLPVYIRLTALENTGEHTAIMLKDLEPVDKIESYNSDWLLQFNDDFSNRFASLLGFSFRSMRVETASVLLAKSRGLRGNSTSFYGKRGSTVLTKETLDLYFTADDVKRLAAYTNQMLDYHAVLDLVPSLARLIFLESFGGDDGGISLSPAQLNLLVGVGLQFKSLEDLSSK
eukprot:TRINITY_DN8157_c0_g1_i7.p1 TRINITY_DN8157_c0_g1~~TRINITY_DN8157_c0_g1_i7.p1  ORF type:complete len:505 (-),score=97.81 TRINITY_DN8157_c0_g1_i7:381-1895(-)